MNLGTFPLTVTQTKIFNSIVILSLTYLACNSFAFGLIIGVYNIIGISYLSSPKHIYEKITFTQKNTITSISIALAWKARSNEVKIRICTFIPIQFVMYLLRVEVKVMSLFKYLSNVLSFSCPIFTTFSNISDNNSNKPHHNNPPKNFHELDGIPIDMQVHIKIQHQSNFQLDMSCLFQLRSWLDISRLHLVSNKIRTFYTI